MTTRERERVTGLADWYQTEQRDFDKRLIGFRYESIREHFVGQRGLEMGSAEGEMTALLRRDFDRLTVVEGADKLLDCIPDGPDIDKVCSLFEDFEPEGYFDTIVMEHILEHVDEPAKLLRRAAQWLGPGGRLIAGVPNGLSFHRLAAVKMGLLSEPCQLNERDLALGHRRVYTASSFLSEFKSAGLKVRELGGVFFKPVSNGQIDEHWNDDMIRGFYELGKDFPEHAAELLVVAELP